MKSTATPRGFAAMDPERRRAISRKGGASVPAEKRSFSQNPQLAASAGRKGGKASVGSKCSFTDTAHATDAGRKGGQVSRFKVANEVRLARMAGR